MASTRSFAHRVSLLRFLAFVWVSLLRFLTLPYVAVRFAGGPMACICTVHFLVVTPIAFPWVSLHFSDGIYSVRVLPDYVSLGVLTCHVSPGSPDVSYDSFRFLTIFSRLSSERVGIVCPFSCVISLKLWCDLSARLLRHLRTKLWLVICSQSKCLG